MSFHSGFGADTFQRIVTGLTEMARHLQECPEVAPCSAKGRPVAKGYESGVLLRCDPRLVDVLVSPVRLPAGFWRRAIRNEHVA